MYEIGKWFDFEASHCLDYLPPEHKCSRHHGHSYRVQIILRSDTLNPTTAFVRDYGELSVVKTFLDARFDHRHLNDILSPLPTSAEVISEFLFFLFQRVYAELYAVEVRETVKTFARFIRPEPLKYQNTAARNHQRTLLSVVDFYAQSLPNFPTPFFTYRESSHYDPAPDLNA